MLFHILDPSLIGLASWGWSKEEFAKWLTIAIVVNSTIRRLNAASQLPVSIGLQPIIED